MRDGHGFCCFVAQTDDKHYGRSATVDRAKKLALNISAIAGEALAAKVRELEQARWHEENQEAIKATNRFVTENGIPRSSKGLRVTK